MIWFFDKILAFILLILFFPLFIILFLVVKLTSSGPFFFKQLRVGKNKKLFTIYKIRTMVKNAEELKKFLLSKNEADGPVFKISNDPRYTNVGKIIARLGLDEIAQLINIIKGDMSFVGPRPLPVDEAKKIPKKYEKRFLVKPGIFSSWVVAGAFHNDFNRWMKLDLQDIKNKSFWYDIKIIIKSVKFFVKLIISNFKI